MQAHSRPGVHAAASARQPGTSDVAYGFQRVVPHGYDPTEHFKAATSISAQPFDTPHYLPLELDFVLGQAAGNTKDSANMRNSATNCLKTKVLELNGMTTQVRLAMPSISQCIAGSVNHPLLLCLMIWSVWPDVTLAARMMMGFMVVGNIESPPIVRQLPLATPSIPIDETWCAQKSTWTHWKRAAM